MLYHLYWHHPDGTPKHKAVDNYPQMNGLAQTLVRQGISRVYGYDIGDGPILSACWEMWTKGNRSNPVVWETNYPEDEVPEIHRLMFILES